MNFENKPTHSLRPYPGNARTHSPKQIKQIARSIERFGFNNPVLVDDDNQIIAGHGRVEAAKLLNLKTVPTVRLSHLSDDDKRAYILADNRLAEKAGYDNGMLAIELQHLADVGFDVSLIGFEPAEVDLIIEGIGDESDQPENQVPEKTSGPPVSRLGDIWMLGKHILVCGDSTDAATYKLLMDDDKAEFVFTEPSPGHDAMDRALVLFAVAVALGVAGNPQAQIRQRGSCLTPKPVIPLDRKVFPIEFQPKNAPAGFTQQFGADVDLTDFRATKTRLQLDVPNDAIRLQHHVVPAPVDLALQHLDIAFAVSPHEGEQLTKEDMAQRLLSQAGIERMRRAFDFGGD
jgi:hypothetical protein